MHRIILSSVSCSVVQYFSALSHKWHDFREENLWNTKCVCVCVCGVFMCVNLCTTLSETVIILRRIQRNTTINVHKSSVNYPLFLSDFHIFIFSIDFRKIFKSNFKKICAVGDELLHEYGLIVAFRKFATASKKKVN